MDTTRLNSKHVKIIAHRGLSGIERENTCPAFLAAANRSYFGIETDIHTTRDGKFVIIHDETTERVSLGENNINVEENDYSAVENIVLPDKDGTKIRQDIKIPLLSEYIAICKKYEKICILEVKNAFTDEEIKKLVEEIKTTEYIQNVIFISFELENCLKLRKILPEHEIQWLIRKDIEVTDELIKIFVDNKLDIDIYYKSLNKENIEKLHSKGIKINCWTCDNKNDAEDLIELGVDFITTNILE